MSQVVPWAWPFVPLVALLCCSALFSASETILFGLSGADRRRLSESAPATERRVARLLAQPADLLVTVLAGNMAVNSAYLAIGNVAILEATHSTLRRSALVGALVLVLILFGEVVPKMIANASRTRGARLVSSLLLIIHQAMWPLRAALRGLVLGPMARLLPGHDRGVSLHELGELVGEASQVGPQERDLLRRVLAHRQLRVRDIMTPRREVASVGRTDSHETIVAAVRRSRVSRLLVHDGSMDRVIGLLAVRPYLLAPRDGVAPLDPWMSVPRYIPAVASLEQLGVFLNRHDATIAVVVDEHGGTAGVVAVEDMVEALLGDLPDINETPLQPPRPMAGDRWLIDGRMSLPEFGVRFAVEMEAARPGNVSGLLMQELGMAPAIGMSVSLGGRRVEVAGIREGAVAQAIVWPIRPGVAHDS